MSKSNTSSAERSSIHGVTRTVETDVVLESGAMGRAAVPSRGLQSPTLAQQATILYGTSVKADNAAELFAMPMWTVG
jgi:triosephosphate isomerase